MFVADNGAIPRSADRGLIEALKATPTARPINGIPRSADRGLIEALPAPGRTPPQFQFRDQLIAASLKQEPFRLMAKSRETIPRSADRGLIEAPQRAVALAQLSKNSAIS